MSAISSGSDTPLRPADRQGLCQAFNDSAGHVRLLSILSPTCPECLSGYSVLRETASAIAGGKLKILLIWIKMIEGDSEPAARQQASLWADRRVAFQGWDAEKEIGELFRRTLGLTRPAWDVYLIYPPASRWTGMNPPAPECWMHQLELDSGADPRSWLDRDRLWRELERPRGSGG